MVRAIMTAYWIGQELNVNKIQVAYELTELLQKWYVEAPLKETEIHTRPDSELRDLYLSGDDRIIIKHNPDDPLIDEFTDILQ